MKILFYTMTLQKGGAERVITNLANYFIKNNEVAILNLYYNKISYNLDKNIEIIFPKTNKKFNFKYLLEKTNEFSPDIIIAFCPTMCFLSCFMKIFFKSFKNIKLIVSERNDPKHEYTNFFLKWCANFLYSKADGIVFQTEEAMHFFHSKVTKKACIIPNPINAEFYKVNYNYDNVNNTIVNVGRITEQKNQKLLIEACSKLFKKYPNYNLKIYGEGNLKEELLAYTKKLKINDKVEFMGNTNKIYEELLHCKIFVLSSNYEGMPNALMEAMAIGIPCISTDCPCGGPKKLITHNENGILVPTNNADLLTNAIESLILNEKIAKKISKNSRKIVKDYNIDSVNKKWLEIIKK